MTKLSFIAAAFGLLLTSCSHALDPDKVSLVEDFNRQGHAIAFTDDEIYYVIDCEYNPISPGYTDVEPLDNGFFIAHNGTERNHLLDRDFAVVDSALIYIPCSAESDLIWSFEVNDVIRAFDVKSRSVVFEENCEYIETNPSSVTVLRRVGASTIYPKAHISTKKVIDFMLVGPDGSIIAPWGKIKYIGPYSDGRAVFTNEAVYFMARESNRYFTEKCEFETMPGFRTHHFGYLDELGNVALPAIYERAKPFAGGTAKVEPITGDANYNWIIDINGNKVGKF